MGCVCRCGDDIEAGVVSTTYRCCAAVRGYLCHHSQEREDDEGIGMGEMDNRLEEWAWLEDYEDDRWEAEDATDSAVINLNLTEDEEEEIWE
jgi:hypothetical protein